MSYKSLIIHGPNLNLLGKREPEIYGHTSFSDLCKDLENKGRSLSIQIENFQSNNESTLIDRLHQCVIHSVDLNNQNCRKPDIIIINPAGFSHTSVALLDALLATKLPFIEVHLSNIHNRETFRHFSYFSAKAEAVICGMGVHGYFYALNYAIERLKHPSKK